MNTVLHTADLLKARPPFMRLTYDFCSNCGLFMHERSAGAELCHSCERITDEEMQIWECSKCYTSRIYGIGYAYDTTAKQLSCVGCGQIRRHHFSHVNGRGR